MSQIYITEPPTNGKVLLKTTVGDIDIELWSKEAPLACRNFVQLCLEGYYNGIIFHRIVKDFIAQCGDPTGTGEGGESVYGHTFKDEFHSRLKFSRRGLVGMANAAKDDNSSQFFFTLDRADELTKKHTLFAKVSGDTLYNLLRLNEIATDKEDHPLDPVPKIIKTEVLSNPFDDIVPRIDARKLNKTKEKVKSQSKATKNFSLLSFGEEAEEDEEETTIVSKELRIKSSHDVLTDDSKLSAQPAVDQAELRRRSRKRKKKDDERGNEADGVIERAASDEVLDELSHKKVLVKEEDTPSVLEERLMKDERVKIDKKEALRLETEQLKRELRQAKKKREVEKEEKKAEEEDLPEAIKALRKEKALYMTKKKTLGKGGGRESQTLDLLARFKSKLSSARGVKDDDDESHDNQVTTKDGDMDTEESHWLSHHLAFEKGDPVMAKDANVQNEDTYDIYDPRNPLNKRRREADKQDNPRKKERNRT